MKKLFITATIFTVIIYNILAQRVDQYRPRKNTPSRYPVIIRNPLNAYGTNLVTAVEPGGGSNIWDAELSLDITDAESSNAILSP